ncbi:hypothetical protein M0804_009715 [Polistes exclamans]|nr:hypothetical protein M0804_009715 [Polistes exclamans]
MKLIFVLCSMFAIIWLLHGQDASVSRISLQRIQRHRPIHLGYARNEKTGDGDHSDSSKQLQNVDFDYGYMKYGKRKEEEDDIYRFIKFGEHTV